MAEIVNSKMKWLRRIGLGVFVVFLFLVLILRLRRMPGEVERILNTCWTCEVIANVYDVISFNAMRIVPDMQFAALAAMSVGLALWIVHKTYVILVGDKADQLPSMKVEANYFTEIYKRFVLAFVIAFVFLGGIGTRTILENTFELAVDFGSSVGRHILQRQIINHGFGHNITDGSRHGEPDCRRAPRERVWQEGAALSDTTRNSLVCLALEMDLVRREYQKLGWLLIQNGGPAIMRAIAFNVGTRVMVFFGGRALARGGGRVFLRAQGMWLNNRRLANEARRTRTLERLRGQAEAAGAAGDTAGRARIMRRYTSVNRSARQAREAYDRSIGEVADALAGGVPTGAAARTIRRQRYMGRLMYDTGLPAFLGNATTFFYILASADLRMALAGIILVGGFIFINLLFAFIIIEQLLFMGVAIILFPFIAACWVFEATRRYAQGALQSLMKFAIGLIAICFVAAFCIELNLWILGGMFGSYSGITSVSEALDIIRLGDAYGEGYGVGDFVDMVDNNWYFLWALLAVALNAKLLGETGKFASWFGGEFSQSKMGSEFFGYGKSAAVYMVSATQKGSVALKDKMMGKPKEGRITLLERLRGIRLRRRA